MEKTLIRRCAVFVDAGYLLEAGAALLGTPGRRNVQVKDAEFVEFVKQRAHQQTGVEFLRLYWCDGAPDRRPTPAQRRLAVLDYVCLVTGNLVAENGTSRQKGVDAAILRSMRDLQQSGISDIILLSGDADLLEGIENAGSSGVRTWVWGVDSPEGESDSVALDLRMAADHYRNLTAADIEMMLAVQEPDRAGVRSGVVALPAQKAPVQPSASAPSEAAEAEPSRCSAGEAVVAAAPRSGPRPAPPKQPLHATPPAYPSSHVPLASPTHSGADSLSALSSISVQEERDKDQREDTETAPDSPWELGQRYGRRWVARASELEIDRLFDGEPRIPRALDAELLKLGAGEFREFAPNDDLFEETRHELRAGFWAGARGDSST